MFHAVSDGASPGDGGAVSLGDGDSLRDGEGKAGSELRHYLQAEGLKLPRELGRRSWVAAILSIASAHVWIALAILVGRYLPGGPAAIVAVGFVLILLA